MSAYRLVCEAKQNIDKSAQSVRRDPDSSPRATHHWGYWISFAEIAARNNRAYLALSLRRSAAHSDRIKHANVPERHWRRLSALADQVLTCAVFESSSGMCQLPRVECARLLRPSGSGNVAPPEKSRLLRGTNCPATRRRRQPHESQSRSIRCACCANKPEPRRTHRSGEQPHSRDRCRGTCRLKQHRHQDC